MLDKEYLELNAKLQQKKNALRKDLKSRGILKKGATNQYDKYKYFSEAQYKELFTDLFSEHGLELKFTELEYNTFEGTEKQANGRMPKLQFTLMDIDTGYGEDSVITGEGMDKGDKAGYKAYTGALKYFLANTFMVATGDDPEKDSPDNKMNKRKDDRKDMIEEIKGLYTQAEISGMLSRLGLTVMEELTQAQLKKLIDARSGINSRRETF